MSQHVEFWVVNIGYLSMNKYWGETERVRAGTATCTLVASEGVRILVDPSPTGDLLAPMLFNRTGLRPEAIDLVYVTHYHADHYYGLDLFTHAMWCMAEPALHEWQPRSAEEKAIKDQFKVADGYMPPDIMLYPAPGHTLGLTGLKFDTAWGPLLIAGDAVMTRDYLMQEQGFHNSIDFNAAAETIHRIKREFALVIPGHDNLLFNSRDQ
jgi:glyoxylase-like metal-dependent hydrolase (beta-lactamase superfamily II)